MNSLIEQSILLPTVFTPPKDAIQERDAILNESKDLTVSDHQTNELAVMHGRQLQRHIKDVQDMRKKLTGPLDDAKARLIEVERSYLMPIIAERDRLSQEATEWREKQEKLVQAEMERLRAETERLRKIQIEQEKKAENACTESGQLKAELLAHEASQQLETLVRAPLPEIQKARGSSTKKEVDFVITDLDAFFKAWPQLCEVTPRRAAIKAMLTPAPGSTMLNPDKRIPGISLFYITSTTFISKYQKTT